MAHLIVEQQPADPFLPRNPKAFGFGATGFHHQHTPFAPSALFASHNHNLPVRTVAATSHKRRLERDDEDDENGYGGGDDDDGRQDRRRRASPTDAMDRSPTPERPRKAAPKRLRMAPAAPGKDKAENKSETDQDVGVLLARLPPQSLLPILMELLQRQPELKQTVLAIIPPPSLETAVHTLADAARKLRDAYPYSHAPTPSFASTSFGFGGGSSLFAASAPAQPQRPPANRDEYVLSRLRTPIADFVSTVRSDLSYFSLHQPSTQGATGRVHDPCAIYTYLAALTHHIFSQPPLAVNALCQELQERLVQEWQAWVNRVDSLVNKEGRMYPAFTVQEWANQLDGFAMHTQYPLGQQMKSVRDEWVHRAGWLIGRNAVMSDL